MSPAETSVNNVSALNIFFHSGINLGNPKSKRYDFSLLVLVLLTALAATLLSLDSPPCCSLSPSLGRTIEAADVEVPSADLEDLNRANLLLALLPLWISPLKRPLALKKRSRKEEGGWTTVVGVAWSRAKDLLGVVVLVEYWEDLLEPPLALAFPFLESDVLEVAAAVLALAVAVEVACSLKVANVRMPLLMDAFQLLLLLLLLL